VFYEENWLVRKIPKGIGGNELGVLLYMTDGYGDGYKHCLGMGIGFWLGIPAPCIRFKQYYRYQPHIA